MDDWYIEMGGNYAINGDKIFGRNIFVTLDNINDVRERFHNTDVFATTFAYNNEDREKSDLYGPLYIDLDLPINNEQDYQKIKKDVELIVTSLTTLYYIPIEFIQIYFSGHKGFHIIVNPEVIGTQPHKELNEVFRFIALELKKMTLFKSVDTSIYDKKRLLRLQNSIHSSTNLYKVPVDYDFIRVSTWSDIQQYALEPHTIDYPEPRLVAKASSKFQELYKEYEKEKESYSNKQLGFNRKGENLPCIQSILDNGVSKGLRNNTTIALASSLFQNGLDYDEVSEKISNWNAEKNSPKLSDREILTTVKSAYSISLNGRRYGCRAIQVLGLCNDKDCNLRVKKTSGGQHGRSKKGRTLIR